MAGIYATHSQRVQGAIQLMQTNQIIYDKQARIDHDVNLIEDYFNEIGLEIKNLRTVYNLNLFSITVDLVDESKFSYYGQFNKDWSKENSFNKKDWPKENPIHIKNWSIENQFDKPTMLLENYTLRELLDMYYKNKKEC